MNVSNVKKLIGKHQHMQWGLFFAPEFSLEGLYWQILWNVIIVQYFAIKYDFELLFKLSVLWKCQTI